MRVPFVDLRAQYERHREAIDAAIQSVIDSTSFIGGEPVCRFEREFASAYGVRNCIPCANGTDAIYVVLRMLGIGAGDEVITTALSWISTSETISQAGAKPVFVDIDEHYCIDVEQVAARITPRTRAVIAVHLYGQAARVEDLAELCRARGLELIEDCAQAHFAERDGRRVGLHGRAATFSFYPGKNLGAYGDAGAIVTNDDALAERCRMYANHGALVKHQHRMEGINSRLDGIQAAILSAKLPHVQEWTAARQRIAAEYDARLASIEGIEIPRVRPGSTHVYHLYVIQVAQRDRLRDFLTSNGIGTGIHYPTALPQLEAYRYLQVPAADVGRAVRATQRILSLPMYAEMTLPMVEHVTRSIREFLRGARAA